MLALAAWLACFAWAAPPDPAEQGAQARQAMKEQEPAAVDGKPIQRLVMRLARDGEPRDSFLGRSRIFVKNESSGEGTRRLTVGIIEGPQPSPAPYKNRPGLIDLAYRADYISLNVQEVVSRRVTGRARGEEIKKTYVVRLGDNTLRMVLLSSRRGRFTPQGEFIPEDDKDAPITRLPPAAQVKEWEKLVPELLAMGRVVRT